jgi:hypothetical protein
MSCIVSFRTKVPTEARASSVRLLVAALAVTRRRAGERSPEPARNVGFQGRTLAVRSARERALAVPGPCYPSGVANGHQSRYFVEKSRLKSLTDTRALIWLIFACSPLVWVK